MCMYFMYKYIINMRYSIELSSQIYYSQYSSREIVNEYIVA